MNRLMATDDISPHSRRADARRRKRQRKRRTTLLLSTLLIFMIAASAAAYAERGRISLLSDPPTQEKTIDKQVRVVDRPLELAKGPKRRALTTKQPLRLWIGGDSLAGSLGPGLGRIAADTGIVAPVYESRVSSGLANPGFFNWPKRATSELARLKPEAVAFIIGTNDYPIVTGKQLSGDSPIVEGQQPTRPKWSIEYEKKTEEMMQILVGDQNRTVFWVSPPVMKDSKINNGVRQIGELQRNVAKRFPTVVWIDGYSLFDDANGEYATRIVDTNGDSILARAGDGVHLSPAGGEYLGGAVFDEIDLVWHIRDQAVTGYPQRVVETKGSTYIPGTRPSTLGPATLSNGVTSTTSSSGVSGATGTTGTTGSSSTTSSSSSTSTTTTTRLTGPPTTRPPGTTTTSTTRTTIPIL